MTTPDWLAEAAELPRQATCFFEVDPKTGFASKLLAEGVGTLLLTVAVVSAGLMTQRLSHEGLLLEHFAIAVVIAGALIGLICAFGVVSGGHFNPLITGLQWLAGERGPGCTAAYILVQLIGAFLGSELASLIFGSSVSPVAERATDLALIAGEALATTGLMIVVLGCARSGRAETGPFAVGAWLVAAILVTPSGSYANPALVLASLVSLGPTHLSNATAVSFVAAEVGGALLAFAVISGTHPPPFCRGGRPTSRGRGRIRG